MPPQNKIGDDFEQLLEKANNFTELQFKMIEMQAFAAKTEGWNIVLMKQSGEQESLIKEQKDQLDEMMEKGCKD
jgi:hypothetical protein